MPITPTTYHATPMTHEDLREVMAHEGGLCVTVLASASPMPDESEKNRIAFKAQADVAESTLQRDGVPAAEVASVAATLETFTEDRSLFAGGARGIAAFVKPGWSRVFRLMHDTPDAAVVAETFHVKPLIRQAQRLRRYRVLCVSRHEVALFDGAGPMLRPVTLHPDVPTTMAEALGGPDQVQKVKRAAHEPEDSDQKDDQLRRYFQRVAEPLEAHHLRHDDVPLVLAALPEHQPLYRRASDHRALIAAGVERDPFHEMDEQRLAELALAALDEQAEPRIARIRERLGEAEAHGRAERTLERVAEAAAHGRIETLYLDEDRRVSGEVDHETGRLERNQDHGEATEDALDDLAEMTLRRSGEVVVLDHESMPEQADAVAVLRY